MVATFIQNMVDSEIDIDSGARDAAVTSAVIHATGYLELSTLLTVGDSDSERILSAVAKIAVNLIIRKRKSMDKSKEINPAGILTKEIKQLLDDSTDDNLTNASLKVNNTKITRPNHPVQWRD